MLLISADLCLCLESELGKHCSQVFCSTN